MTRRCFVPPTSATRIALPADKAHHFATVLQLRGGDSITLHDGQGAAANASLVEVSRKRVIAERTGPWQPVLTEPKTRVTIFQSLPRTGDKVEQVLQHGTELGAAGFVLFPSEKAQAKLEGNDRIERKVARWEELIRNAAEQSGRGVLPTITWCAALSEAQALLPRFDTALLLEQDAAPLRETLPRAAAQTVAVLVGPESGFTPTEQEALRTVGAVGASLGPRVLRTETAALAALAQLLYARNE